MAYDDIEFIGFFLPTKITRGAHIVEIFQISGNPNTMNWTVKSDKKLMVNIAAVGSAKCSPKSKKRGGHESESESHWFEVDM